MHDFDIVQRNPSIQCQKPSGEARYAEGFITTASSGRKLKRLGQRCGQQNSVKAKAIRDKLSMPHQQTPFSEEFVKASKTYRMLRSQLQATEADNLKKLTQLTQARDKLKMGIAKAKNQANSRKLALQELKNQYLELSGVLQKEKEEGYKLQEQLQAMGLEQLDDSEKSNKQEQELQEQPQLQDEEAKDVPAEESPKQKDALKFFKCLIEPIEGINSESEQKGAQSNDKESQDAGIQ